MPLYIATSCVAEGGGADAALLALESWGVSHVQVGPGREPGPGWGRAAARFEGRLRLHHAYLERPDVARWNLAATDDDWRRRSLVAAREAMRGAVDLGARSFSLHPGYALSQGLDPLGRPIGESAARDRALDRLASSLDALANLADGLKLELLVENAPGRRSVGDRRGPTDVPIVALCQEPQEIIQTLERVQAPLLGVQLDVAHLLIVCQARRFEPEPVLDELVPWVRAIELSRPQGQLDAHRSPGDEGIELELARRAGGLAWPVIFEARGLPRVELLAVTQALEQALTPAVAPAESTRVREHREAELAARRAAEGSPEPEEG